MENPKVKLSDVSYYFTGKIEKDKVAIEDYISTTNMLPDMKGIENAKSLPPAKKLNMYKVDDILISNIRPYFKKIWKSDRIGGCDGDILNIRADISKVIPEFLFYVLFTEDFFEYIMVGAKGVKMPRGDKAFTMNYEFELPEHKEQKNIVNQIKPYFEKIESNITLLHCLEEYSQLLFHKWFVDFNFPDENGSPYKGSSGEMVKVYGHMIPIGWEQELLSSSANFINGLAMQKFPPTGDDDLLPVIKIKEINNGGFHKDTDFMSKSIKDEYIIQDGDLLFPWSGSLSINIWSGGVGGLNQHIFKVKSKKYQKWFLYHWINKHMRYFEQIAYGKKTTMGHINRHHLNLVPILIPDLKTMTKMDNIMSPIYEKIVSLKKENALLEKTRDLLIKKLIK